MTEDRDYYRVRAEQERARAAAAKQPECRRLHAELATLYDDRAASAGRPRLRIAT